MREQMPLALDDVRPGNLVELIELKDHPWFIAGQFHPEFKSRPLEPQPLFRAFVAASLKSGHKRQATGTKKSKIQNPKSNIRSRVS